MNEKHHEPTQSTEQPDTEQHHEAEPRPAPRIYVASLADYNNGVLHGTWMDAAREPSAIRADIDAMLQKSRQPDAEEFAIHDFDQFGRWRVNEYDSIDLVARIANGIAEHGYAFAAWADLNESEPQRFNDFSDAYLGHFDSVTDYAEQEADAFGFDDSLGILPEALRQYLRFDIEGFARDLQLSGAIAAVDDPSGGVWIFRTDA